MRFVDIVIIVLVAAAVVFAVWTAIRKQKKGSSCCGTGNCAFCDKCKDKTKK